MTSLRCDATTIWYAGVDAVRAKPLVRRTVRVSGDRLEISDIECSRADFDRVLVVGAGKAGTGMTQGLLESIDDWLPITGWINVPEGTEVAIPGVHIHPARPAGINEPTEQAAAGAREIMKLARDAGPRDLCIALISGGGSALLPVPKDGITLQDKLEVTRFLSGAGADITELNTVRKHLSQIKGGGLLRACRAGMLVTLVLSDVLGDPLDLIASGPTVPDSTSPEQALLVLARFDPHRSLPDRVYDLLEREVNERTISNHDRWNRDESDAQTAREDNREMGRQVLCQHETRIIGNNALAVDEAGIRAEQLGYNHVMQSATSCEGAAEEVGRHLAEMTLLMLRADSKSHRHNCLITGGEPTVKLAPAEFRGQGGRNQQVVLAAYDRLRSEGLSDRLWSKLCLLSGGTDGEDGPTDAAGAILDQQVHREAQRKSLDPQVFLQRNDAYNFFSHVGGLLRTGPTGTNVCDVRIAIISRET